MTLEQQVMFWVLARFALRQYLASPLYTGGEPR
jgi:hypothetical protein